MKKLLLSSTAVLLASALWSSSALAGFADVDQNARYSWAKPSIDEMNRRGILNGFPDGTFRPGEPVTKAQFTVMVYRLFPKLRNTEPESIAGVPDGHWASKEFKELYSTTWPYYAADVQNQDESYTYQPDKNMSRWDVLMTLEALFDRLKGPESPETAADLAKELAAIRDIPQKTYESYDAYERDRSNHSLLLPVLELTREQDYTSMWAGDFDYVKARALYRFTQVGIITPDAQGHFRPNDHVTRAEMVTILNRMLAAAGEDYAYEKPEEILSGAYLTPGSSFGSGSSLYGQSVEENVVLTASPDWYEDPQPKLTRVAIRAQSDQPMDLYVTISGQTLKYSYEELSGDGLIVDVGDAVTFHVRAEARYPEQLTEDGNNQVMIYFSDPARQWEYDDDWADDSYE